LIFREKIFILNFLGQLRFRQFLKICAKILRYASLQIAESVRRRPDTQKVPAKLPFVQPGTKPFTMPFLQEEQDFWEALFRKLRVYLMLSAFQKVFRVRFILTINPCGEGDQLIVYLNFAKNGWAKRSNKREAKLRVKNQNLKYFDAKLRFALLAPLRTAIFSEIQVDN